MPFELPPLPYDPAALAPHMSSETLDFHHGKHHRAYVEKTNALLDEAGMGESSLVDLIRKANPGPLRSNAGQLWNHSFFWQCLSPERQTLSGNLLSLIASAYGTSDELTGALCDEAAAHFGSGWVWLLLDRGALRIVSLHDGDTPLAHEGMVPLLGLDVWEHAYYIDYRDARPAYAKAVLGQLVDWDFVARNFDGQGALRADQG